MLGRFGQQDLLMGLDVGFEDKREPRGHSAFGEGGQMGVAFNGGEKDWSQRRFWGKDGQFSFGEIKCGAPIRCPGRAGESVWASESGTQGEAWVGNTDLGILA